MTFEEAKKILETEGFHMVLSNKVIYQNGAIREFEKPEVCEAIKVANANRWTVGLSPIEWYERESRLKKELVDHASAPVVSGKEESSKGNPALKEAASQFNDALLYEQAKQIGEQSEKIRKLEHEKLGILEIASSSKRTIAGQGKKIKHLGKEIARLNKIIRNKNEELRLTKIREKDLAELGFKYVVENEELEKKLAKMVGINAKCMRAARESINDVIDSYAAKYAKSTLDELKDKAYESFNAKAHKFGLVVSRDGKGIPDQMIRVGIAEELSKVLDDVIDQFLLFGEIIIKE